MVSWIWLCLYTYHLLFTSFAHMLIWLFVSPLSITWRDQFVGSKWVRILIYRHELFIFWLFTYMSSVICFFLFYADIEIHGFLIVLHAIMLFVWIIIIISVARYSFVWNSYWGNYLKWLSSKSKWSNFKNRHESFWELMVFLNPKTLVSYHSFICYDY